MMHLYENLKDMALKLIDMKGTMDDIKAGKDISKIEAAGWIDNEEAFINTASVLDEYLKKEYPMIKKLCEAGNAMQQAARISDNSAEIISETKRLQDSLVTDYYGILVSVLVKHKAISHVKEFIKSVD